MFYVLCIALLYTLASTMDYYIAKAQELDKAVELKDSYMKALVSCINGDGRFVWGKEMFECRGGTLGKV